MRECGDGNVTARHPCHSVATAVAITHAAAAVILASTSAHHSLSMYTGARLCLGFACDVQLLKKIGELESTLQMLTDGDVNTEEITIIGSLKKIVRLPCLACHMS